MIQLAARNIKERSDIIDVGLMPRGECDLNFRHHGVATKRLMLSPWLLGMGILCALGGLLAWIVRPIQVPVLVLIGCGVPYGIIVASSRVHRVSESQVLKAGVTGFLMLPIVGTITQMILHRSPRELIIGVLVFGWLPWLIRTADRLTEHAAWWATANPRVSHRMLSLGRVLFRDRFVSRVRLADVARSDAEQQALTGLQTGPGFSFRSLTLAATVIVALHDVLYGHAADITQRFLVMLTVSQVFVLCLNRVQYPGAGQYFFQMLKHWCFIDTDPAAPPCVWQSPCGSAQQRRQPLVVAMILFAFVIGGLELQYHASGALSNWKMIVRAVAIVSSLPFLMLLILFNLAAPVMWQYRRLFEDRSSPLIDPTWTAFDGYSDRLQHSCNPLEQQCLYRGYHPDTGFPVLVDIKLHFEHQLILGATGIGKTALGLIGQISQLIRRRDGAVIIIDCKGDRGMFHTARLEAERQGATFKWFTNKPRQSTYVFNPFNQRQLTSLTMQQIVGLFMMSLNLHHGEDYGRAWFGMAARMLFQEALRSLRRNSSIGRPYSFAEIEKVLRKIAADDAEFKAAQHLAFIIANLSQFEQLNLSPVHDAHHPAVQNAIHMPEVLKEKQVIYFNLVGAVDIGTVGEIARLAMYSAVSAAIDHQDRTGKRPCVHFIIDEAQMVVAQNIEAILTQGRAFGLAYTLSLQTLSQLNRPGGTDLRELVLNNTTVKQYFSARDPESQEHIMKISGEVGYYGASWKQFLSDVAGGNVHMGRAVYELLKEPEPVINITQEVGPRLSAEDISDISRHPNRCVMNIGRTQGFCSYRGAFPVHVDFTMIEAEYERRSHDLPWPDGGDDTIEIAPFWPDANPHTIVPATHPPLIGPGQMMGPNRLRELERRLNEDL